MDIYKAFLEAADQIELHPETFEFLKWDVPTECGSPGCALGWVGHFLGMRTGTANLVAKAIGLQDPHGQGRADMSFYRAIEKLMTPEEALDWHTSPEITARALRLYAGAHHSPKTEVA